ncbi:MAG: class I SAM-dependent methyltransferase [Methanosarcinaceae archaeon]|nr:class I SAM-dependent methyltransferase [Candidatus Cloacimonadota bacterium]MDD4496913.1 class I SAM-dependent methyltransferase [Methanosarcinaceae archaeon]
MKIIKKICFGIYEVYTIFMSVSLFVFLKPGLLIFKKISSLRRYEHFCYKVINFVNYLYPMQRMESLKDNKVKYDIKIYRDTYDREGLNLYFNFFSPDESITNKRILDFGCGVGGKAFELLKYNPRRIVGIDLSSRNIKFAKELIDKINSNNLFYLNLNIFDLKENNQFDTIISFTVFEHIDKELLLPILNKMYELLESNGICIIVFNHYNSKFGMHLKEYIYHPWPQTLFEEYILYQFWNCKLKNDIKSYENSYFPIEYNHGLNGHNADCFMNLNKVSISEFEEMINKSKFNYIYKDLYSKSFLLKLIPILPEKYLIGSATYYLRKF